MPLVTFRVTFGFLVLYSSIRFALNGWVDSLYIDPIIQFPFIEGLRIGSATIIYLLFFVMTLCAFFILLGFLFRISSVLFFLIFTYFEILDKTYYLNHYYLVCLLSFLLATTSANRYFSLDALLWPKIKRLTCPVWQINVLKAQLCIVYFFAGLAKVNPDWLFSAQPLATWLPGKYGIPLIGQWLHLKWVAFAFSWMGCLYDLSIWAFLLMKRTRSYAYIAVVIFHVLTYILFPRIGMFPFIMISSTLIFFSNSWHEKVINYLNQKLASLPKSSSKTLSLSNFYNNDVQDRKRSLIFSYLVLTYFLIQLYLPLRYLTYPDHLFWHERGYRFSWRVMLMEKSGFTNIVLEDPKTKHRKEIDQKKHLTAFQKKEMSGQPDMVFQFVKHIGDQFKAENGYEPRIFVSGRMSLNGRRSKPFFNDTVNVYALNSPFTQKNWILPFKE